MEIGAQKTTVSNRNVEFTPILGGFHIDDRRTEVNDGRMV